MKKFLDNYLTDKIKELSLEDLLDLNVTENFKLKEVLCQHCILAKDINELITSILIYYKEFRKQCKKLEMIRHLKKSPIGVTSFYRCAKHNANISTGKAVTTSRHLFGQATDITLSSLWNSIQTDKQVLCAITSLWDEVIIYPVRKIIHLADNEDNYYFNINISE